MGRWKAASASTYKSRGPHAFPGLLCSRPGEQGGQVLPSTLFSPTECVTQSVGSSRRTPEVLVSSTNHFRPTSETHRWRVRPGCWGSLHFNVSKCSPGLLVVLVHHPLPFSFLRTPQGAPAHAKSSLPGSQCCRVGLGGSPGSVPPWTTATDKRPCDG